MDVGGWCALFFFNLEHASSMHLQAVLICRTSIACTHSNSTICKANVPYTHATSQRVQRGPSDPAPGPDADRPLRLTLRLTASRQGTVVSLVSRTSRTTTTTTAELGQRSSSCQLVV